MSYFVGHSYSFTRKNTDGTTTKIDGIITDSQYIFMTDKHNNTNHHSQCLLLKVEYTDKENTRKIENILIPNDALHDV